MILEKKYKEVGFNEQPLKQKHKRLIRWHPPVIEMKSTFSIFLDEKFKLLKVKFNFFNETIFYAKITDKKWNFLFSYGFTVLKPIFPSFNSMGPYK